MKFYYCLVTAMLFAVTSCTLDKTDYEAETGAEIPEHYEFEEAASINNGIYTISIETLNGTFYKGYNQVHVTATNTQTNEPLSTEEITFLPVKADASGNAMSCPHKYNLAYDAENAYYSGYVVFTEVSNNTTSWKLYLGINGNTATTDISVAEQPNKNLNMTAFTGNDGGSYVIALIAPQRPGVAENELVAGIYKYNTPDAPPVTFPDPEQFSYTEVQGYTLRLDPRMPQPSMGNHSSPNNQDLTQHEDSLYYGVVNYTMTGNWTLNFILENQNGLIIKGTEVPTDFTPGIEGVKSELHIDILF
ncbi:hypothetical protein AM493_17185 [Flavobacterium akiainvivens]|uniref:YtkA-like domain-containing protein n=1 Tax=Flavobacterium akiainvivens TaxID=1202724 RepID=A0A0N0RR74_9FLAO|nr:hypothetical protein [Flavobacterium akiainvivens]KOS08399.1 hypothetical protein AM493_17185 [Flavobacterium akiainvivens]